MTGLVRIQRKLVKINDWLKLSITFCTNQRCMKLIEPRTNQKKLFQRNWASTVFYFTTQELYKFLAVPLTYTFKLFIHIISEFHHHIALFTSFLLTIEGSHYLPCSHLQVTLEENVRHLTIVHITHTKIIY